MKRKEKERRTESAVGFTGESRAKEKERRRKVLERARHGKSKLKRTTMEEEKERNEEEGGDSNARILQSAGEKER